MKEKPIYNIEELIHKDLWSKSNTVGLCHGCFDVVHIGHIKQFEESKSVCDILIVSVTSDRYVLKGDGRPIFNINERVKVLSAIKFIDFVVICDNKTASPIINILKPDFFIKGVEYSDQSALNNNLKIEEKSMLDIGGEVVFIGEKLSSSTSIISRILSERSKLWSDC